jgi:hypothetical protein
MGNELESAPLWKMPVEGGSATRVMDSVRGRIFTPTERGIYFAAGPITDELRFLDFASGAVRTVAALEARHSANAAISPDARWALYTRREQTGANLILVENFR